MAPSCPGVAPMEAVEDQRQVLNPLARMNPISAGLQEWATHRQQEPLGSSQMALNSPR